MEFLYFHYTFHAIRLQNDGFAKVASSSFKLILETDMILRRILVTLLENVKNLQLVQPRSPSRLRIKGFYLVSWYNTILQRHPRLHNGSIWTDPNWNRFLKKVRDDFNLYLFLWRLNFMKWQKLCKILFLHQKSWWKFSCWGERQKKDKCR